MTNGLCSGCGETTPCPNSVVADGATLPASGLTLSQHLDHAVKLAMEAWDSAVPMTRTSFGVVRQARRAAFAIAVRERLAQHMQCVALDIEASR